MYRKWNVFGRLRQALVHIQTTNALGRRPRLYVDNLCLASGLRSKAMVQDYSDEM